jgi:hypothetical protein
MIIRKATRKGGFGADGGNHGAPFRFQSHARSFYTFSELWAIRRKQCLRVESKISCVHALSSSKLPHESLTHAPLVLLDTTKKADKSLKKF